jgi:hypothetical protein
MAVASNGTESQLPVIALATEAVETSGSGTELSDVLLNGFARNGDWSWTPGTVLYAGPDGAITDIPYTGSGEFVQVIGVAMTYDIIRFDPDYTIIQSESES